MAFRFGRPTCFCSTTVPHPAPALQALEGLVPMAVELVEACLPTPTLPDDDATCRDDTEKGEFETRWTSNDILLAAQVKHVPAFTVVRTLMSLLYIQLGILASQHHRSEYSCQKYGPKGRMLAISLICVICSHKYARRTCSLCTTILTVPRLLSTAPGSASGIC